jgi:beta-glucosidase
MDVSEEASERTLFEIYYPPFEGAIQSGVGSIMCSYNKVNGTHACENAQNLNTDLRDRLGFKGWVLTDFGGAKSTSLDKGLDQEMMYLFGE